MDPPAGLPATATVSVPVTAPPLPESSVLQLATAVADLIQDRVAAGRNPLMSGTPSAGPVTAGSTSSPHTTATPPSSAVPGSGKLMLIVT